MDCIENPKNKAVVKDKSAQEDLRRVTKRRQGKHVMVEETPKTMTISLSDHPGRTQNDAGLSGIQKSSE